MNSNPICHPSPANKMKCSFLDYVQLLMISRAEWWTQTPSTNPLQPKNEMLIFGLRSTSDDWPGWSMDSNPIHHPSPAKKWNPHFCITFNFWWLAGLVDGLEPHPPPLSSQKNEMLIFGFCSTSDDQPGWLMDSNPICHPSPAKKWNAHFWIMFNFWWSARLVNGLKPHPPPLCSQKNEMLIFGLHSTSDDSRACRWTWTPSTTCLQPKNEMLIFWLCSTSDDWPGWSMNSNPICHPSPANKMKCSFLEYAQLLMISRACRWTWTPSTTCLQPKNEMLIFWLCSTSDDWPGWLMDSNPICHPSPANKMKCFFLDYVHFWWSARLVDGLKPRLPPLSSQRNEMLIFVLCSTFNDRMGWSMDSNPIHHPSPAKTVKCSFLYYIQHLMLARLVNGLEPHLPPLSSQKNEMLIFGLHSTSDDWPGWSMDSNPIHHPSPANKMKCFFLDFVQLLMISQAGQWTQTPSTTPFHPKKWNPHFWITFNFWRSAGLVDGLEPHPPPLSSQKMKCSYFDYVQLLMIGRAVQWTQTPSTTPL